MTLNILFFSTLRDVTAESELSMDLDEGVEMTVEDVLARLYVVYPKLREWDAQLLVALDQNYVERSAKVSDGQELAVMPPVQGG
jgi:molybdopterin converting factor small subunit